MFAIQRHGDGGKEGEAVANVSLVERAKQRKKRRLARKDEDEKADAATERASPERDLSAGPSSAAASGDAAPAAAPPASSLQRDLPETLGASSFDTDASGADGEETDKAKAARKRLFLPLWLREPTTIDAESAPLPISSCARLSAAVAAQARKSGFENLFPVQQAVYDAIVDPRHGDICVCAPTGSGKTLAYALPIVSALAQRSTRRLRCAVIVPSRDLAVQVLEVFRKIAPPGIRVASSYGQQSFAREQQKIMGTALSGDAAARGSGGETESLNLLQRFCVCPRTDPAARAVRLLQPSLYPCIDILIATPGRLSEHIQSTPGFSLQDLEFLVIDETDRLLQQSYHDWTTKIFSAMSGPNASTYVKKCLFSATLTRNPKKIASLRLVRPTFYSATTNESLVRYSLPTGLEERFIVTVSGQKPLALFHLLQTNAQKSIIVFTASLDSTHRLFRLADLFLQGNVAEFSGSLTQKQRDAILDSFRRKKTRVLVCSDVMARGLDVRGVDVVINYDTPAFVKTYVHRVGRTARAGASGSAYSLVLKEQVRHFKEMVRKIEHSAPKQQRVQRDVLEEMSPRYVASLAQLRRVMEDEQMGKLDARAALSRSYREQLEKDLEAAQEKNAGAGIDELEDAVEEPAAKQDANGLAKGRDDRKGNNRRAGNSESGTKDSAAPLGEDIAKAHLTFSDSSSGESEASAGESDSVEKSGNGDADEDDGSPSDDEEGDAL